jgi:uncharacterized protein (TIGR03435 family)
VRTRPQLIAVFVTTVLCTVAVAWPIQQAPAFEVASLKPNTISNGARGGCRGSDSKISPNDLMRATVPLGRCVITAARLSHLLNIAFDIPIERISGLPAWDGPSRFDIEAKADDPASTTERQLLTMLQRLLTEQFKLTVHRELRDSATFDLVVAKNGPKNLHKSDTNGHSMVPSGAGLAFAGYSMDDLAQFLSSMPSVARPVRNLTALQGTFDFRLDVLDTKPDDILNFKLAISRWDTIFSDIQQQLGVRLEASKGHVETLIIEHVEKPWPPNIPTP